MSKLDPILKETYIEEMMNEYRKEALRKISTVAAHQVVEDIAMLIAHSFFNAEEEKCAARLADHLDLDKIDFLAILRDEEGFEQLLMEERERLYA